MASEPKTRAPSPRVAAKREAFREAILAAATRAVEEDGLEALTVKRLADELGVALGGIYHYVDGIEEVLIMLEQRALEGLGEAMREADDSAVAAGRSAFERLATAIRVFVDDAARAPGRHRLVDALLSAQAPLFSPERAVEAEGALAAILAHVARLFDAAVAEGALAPGDPDVRTHLVWAALHGLDHFRKRDTRAPRRVRHRALVSAMLEALFSSFGASPRRARAVLGPAASPALPAAQKSATARRTAGQKALATTRPEPRRR